jgi:sarcosine oxidase subunit beta
MNIIRTFAGLRPFCEDDHYIFDKVEEIKGLFLATGHHGQGLILSPLTGKLVSELVAEKHPSYPIEEFSYSRFKEHLLTEKEIEGDVTN